jgi:CRP/FNR family cyclic AMP-dependent transcriptional regulator
VDVFAAACESERMAVSIDHLREVNVLRGLKDADIASLAADLAERRVAAGDPIVGEGTGGVAFFFILEGETSVSVGGEEVATLGRGEYVGELALLDPEGPRSATVTAKTDVVLAAMSAWQFRPFVLAHPEVAWTLLQRLARPRREAQAPVEPRGRDRGDRRHARGHGRAARLGRGDGRRLQRRAAAGRRQGRRGPR